jgi:glutamyl-tRNA synthetase
MGITTVVRGSEWLSTFALHNELYKALGFKMPNYLHTMLLCKIQDGARVKFSKRKHPDAALSYYTELGFLPNAIIEYCYTLLNSSAFEEWRKQNPNANVFDYKLDISKMNGTEALWDLEKLNNISKHLISRLSAEEVYEKTLNWAKSYGKQIEINNSKMDFEKELTNNKQKWKNIFSIDRGGDRPRADIAHFSEVATYFDYFLISPNENNNFKKSEQYKLLQTADAKKIIEEYKTIYNKNDDKTTWWEKLKQMAISKNYATDNKEFKANPQNFKGNMADFVKLIRLNFTGRENTPDLFEILKIINN